MLRPKKVPFAPIFLVLILILVCLIAAQYISRHNGSAHKPDHKTHRPCCAK